jgi:hypothetical protein
MDKVTTAGIDLAKNAFKGFVEERTATISRVRGTRAFSGRY